MKRARPSSAGATTRLRTTIGLAATGTSALPCISTIASPAAAAAKAMPDAATTMVLRQRAGAVAVRTFSSSLGTDRPRSVASSDASAREKAVEPIARASPISRLHITNDRNSISAGKGRTPTIGGEALGLRSGASALVPRTTALRWSAAPPPTRSATQEWRRVLEDGGVSATAFDQRLDGERSDPCLGDRGARRTRRAWASPRLRRGSGRWRRWWRECPT